MPFRHRQLTFSLALSLSLFVTVGIVRAAPTRPGAPTRSGKSAPIVSRRNTSPQNASPQNASPIVSAKRAISHKDYEKWRSVQSPSLTRDGRFGVFLVAGLESDSEMTLRDFSTGQSISIPRGRAPQFTPDSKWLIYTLAPAAADMEKARKEKKAPADFPRSVTVIRELSTGKTETIEKVRAVRVAPDAGATVVLTLESANAPRTARPATPGAPPSPEVGEAPGFEASEIWSWADAEADYLDATSEDRVASDFGANDFQGGGRTRPGGAGQGRPTPGGAPGAAPAGANTSEIVLRDLNAATSVTIADTTDFALTDDGRKIAYVVDSRDDTRDGVFLRTIGSESVLSIARGPANYKNLTFDDAGKQLAFLKLPAAPRPTTPPTGATPTAPGTSAPGTSAPAPTATPPALPGGLTLPPGVSREEALNILKNTPEIAKPFLPAGVTVAQAIAALEAQGAQGAPTPPAAPAPAAASPQTAPAAKPEPPKPPTLWLWRDGESAAKEIVGEKTSGIPDGHVLADSAPRFSADGAWISLATAPKPATPNGPIAETPIPVDVWSTRDPYLQTVQKLRAEADRRKSFTALYWVRDNKLVPLESDAAPGASVDRFAKKWGVASNTNPYLISSMWGDSFRDIALLDLKTGARKPFLTKQSGGVSLSPNEKWAIWWDSNKQAWLARAVENERAPIANLTEKLAGPFYNENDDRPADASPAGIAGWTDDDRHVIVYDRYDAWLIDPSSGDARRLTFGRDAGLVFRYYQTDPDARTIDPKKAVLWNVTDERTKARGFYNASALDARPARIAMLDRAIGAPVKAKNTDRVLFTLETYDTPRDLWTAESIAKLDDRTRLTDANPQQKDYVWGKSELIEYKNGDGKPMRAILTLPENFDPSKKYPMLVYIYERLTDGLHTYVTPNVGTSINVARYVSNGYIILRPDITYTTGYPGESATKNVLPAVQFMLEKGYVDPARVGIQGHSWGAYQITYLVTRTNLFRCVQAGAAVSNMVSAYGGIRYGTGISRAGQYEKGQSRIGQPPWKAPLQYIENSPIFWVDKVQTPYLTIHNDADGAVPFTQGIEFYIALRRLGKEAFLFNYNGEDHNLINRENMKHWTVHQAEYFDHYLLGAPRPTWMDSGVPFLSRGQRDLRPIFGKN